MLLEKINTGGKGILITLLLIAGCSANNVKETGETLDITVSIVPQEYFVEKIGGDRVAVNVIVEPGASPHTYEPKPKQLQNLSDAQAYITIGVSFEEAWMTRLKSVNQNMVIIDSGAGIERLPLSDHHHHEEEEHDHREETLDPHIWLSPKLVKIQAQNIYEGLVKIDPTGAAEYKMNLEKFLKEIDILDGEIRQKLGGIKNRKFMVFHPSWGYFAHDYNLEQIPVEVGGVEPSAAELGKLIAEAKEEGIKVVFAQPEFSTKSAQTIAKEIGGEVVLINTLAFNWSENLLQVSETFGEVLKK